MKTFELLKKEILLGNNASTIIFTSLSFVMFLIPNYPMYVSLYYVALSIMIMFSLNQINNEILYTVLLPVKKTDTVKARFLYSLILECLVMIVGIILGFVKYAVHFVESDAGTEITVAYVGLQLIMLAVFNLIFLGNVYKNPYKVGKLFFIASIVYFAVMAVFELPVWNFRGFTNSFGDLQETGILISEEIAKLPWYSLPKIGYYINSRNASDFLVQLPFFVVGILIFVLSWILSFKRAKKQFENFDM